MLLLMEIKVQKACLSELKNHRYPALPCVQGNMEPNGSHHGMTGPLLCFALLGRGRFQQEHRTVVHCSMSDSKWSSSSLGTLPMPERNSLQYPSVSFLSQLLAFQEWICFTGQCFQAGVLLRALKLALMYSGSVKHAQFRNCPQKFICEIVTFRYKKVFYFPINFYKYAV